MRENRNWKRSRRMLVLSFIAIGLPSPVKGEGMVQQTSAMNDPNVDIWKSFATVALVLLLIIGLIILLVKIAARKDMPWMKNRAIQSLGGIALGQHKSLQIIDLGEKIYVIGVGENVQLIDKIEQKHEMKAIRSRFETKGKAPGYSEGHSEKNAFQQLLNDKLQHVIRREQKLDEVLTDRSDRKP